jgi:GNAT superfamily N-acetyltransferase
MNAQAITIRRISAADVDAFRQVRLEALRCEPASYASTQDEWASLPIEAWQRRLNDPVFVAFQDGEPIGLIGLLREAPARSAHRAQIVMVYVRKSLRGSGVARDLLNTVESYARDIGVTQLELTVNAENPVATGFYLREGFFEVGRIPDWFLHEGNGTDHILMVRRVARSSLRSARAPSSSLLTAPSEK